jgi:hypothetical protein
MVEKNFWMRKSKTDLLIDKIRKACAEILPGQFITVYVYEELPGQYVAQVRSEKSWSHYVARGSSKDATIKSLYESLFTAYKTQQVKINKIVKLLS